MKEFSQLQAVWSLDSGTKLDPQNVDKIVYLKTNIGKMNNARSALTIETAEEKTERKSKTYQKDQSAVTPLQW